MNNNQVKAGILDFLVKILAVCCVFMGLAIISLKTQYKKATEAAESEKANYEAKIFNLSFSNTVAKNQMENQIKDYEATINDLYDACEVLDNQNKSLVASNEEYYSKLEEVTDKLELYEKYDYALFFGGKRNDITYDQLVTLEECIDESSIPDPDLILAWVMVESHGFTGANNPTSSAKGYGQFLDGTSKFVYTKLLGEKEWTPSVAFDGETNIRMMVAYTDYLYDYYGGPYGMLKGYTGSSNPEFLNSYTSKLNTYLRHAGKSFNDMYQY